MLAGMFGDEARTQTGRAILPVEIGADFADEHADRFRGFDLVFDCAHHIEAVKKIDCYFAAIGRDEAIVRATDFMRKQRIRQGGPQAFERTDAIVRIELCAAAAHDLRRGGVGTDRGDLHAGRGLQGQGAVILQKNDALGSSAADQRARFGPIVGALGRNCRISEAADAVDQPQRATRGFANSGGRGFASLNRCEQLFAAIARRTGHFEIETAVESGGCRFCAEPVGHGEAVKTPMRLQQAVDEIRLLADIRPVEAVVGCHQRPGLAALYGRLEWRQIDFVQRARIDIAADRVALIFGIIGDEVLYRRRDALGLQAGDIGDDELGAEIGVLRIAFEVAPVQRRAMHVDGRREQHARALGERFAGERAADFVNEIDVPCR